VQNSPGWIPVQEPFRRTLARNVGLAAVVGFALALQRQNLRLLPPLAILALWFSLGGHYVELAFLNGVRPRIASGRLPQLAWRVVVWFVGGAILFLLMATTARVLPIRPLPFRLWWYGGCALIGVELLVHAGLALRGAPNFYSGRA
jgi:hypothetical protein